MYSLMDKQIKKIWYIYTIGYFPVTNNRILSFVAIWMELEDKMLSKISQKQRDKYFRLSLAYGG
jgi:hypothetical protein